MTPARPEQSGGVALTASRLTALGLASASTVLFARWLGPPSFGIYASALAVLAVISVLGNLGIDQLYLRHDVELDELNIRSVQLALVTAGLALGGGLLWPGLSIQARLCITLLGVAAATDDLKLPYLLEPQRRLDFASRARRELLLRTIVVVVSVTVALVHPSPLAISQGILVAGLLGLLLCRHDLPSVRLFRESGSLTILRQALPYCLAGAVYTAYFQIDAAILATLRPAVEVGYYTVAYSMVFALVVFPVAMNNDVMLSRFYGTDRSGDEARRILRRFGIASVATGLVALAGVEVVGPLAIRVLFGQRYSAAIGLLRILGLALLPHFINSWEGNALVGIGRIRLVLTIQSALLLFNVVGNVILIPAHGASGAAWMTACTEALGALLYTSTIILMRYRGSWHGPLAT